MEMISYFGILRQCRGPGFGGLLLMDAITRVDVWLGGYGCISVRSIIRLPLATIWRGRLPCSRKRPGDEAWPDRLAAASTANIGERYIAQPEIVPFENSIGTVTRTNERS